MIAGPRPIGVDVRIEQRRIVRADEGRAPHERLERDTRERVLIGPTVHLPSLDLLGRHVVERADELPRLGQRAVRTSALRKAEVREVRTIALTHEDVPRLDVAVDQIEFVRRVQAIGDRRQDPQGTCRLQTSLSPQEGAQVFPLDVAHRHEQAAGVLTRFVDRDHGRMLERGCEPGLTQETVA